MLAMYGNPGYPAQGFACFLPPGKHEVISFLSALLQAPESSLLCLFILPGDWSVPLENGLQKPTVVLGQQLFILG